MSIVDDLDRALAPPAAAPARARTDGWYSALTGLGMDGQDKRVGGAFVADAVSDEEAAELWRGDDLAARVVETWPSEMLRQGWDIKVQAEDGADPAASKDLCEDVAAAWDSDELDVASALWTALCYRRAYGGAGILLGANDGSRDLAEPLAVERVRSLDWLTVLEPRELTVARWQTDPYARDFGRPEVYRLSPVSPGGAAARQGVEVHASRLVVLDGIRVSRRQVGLRAGWGDSVLTRVQRVLRDFNMGWSAAGILLNDFAQPVFKMKGLAELLATDKDDVVKVRMRAVELSRSTARAVLIDGDEEFERKQTPVTGLPEMLDRFATRLAAAADMPLTLLMGQSPAGLNATGESDIRFFYDRVAAAQQRELRPVLTRLARVTFAALGYAEPDRWSVAFRPLWQPTEKERAEARYVQAQADVAYVNAGVLTPDEVARSRFAGDEYSFETQVDMVARDAMAALPDQEDNIPEPGNFPAQESAPGQESLDREA